MTMTSASRRTFLHWVDRLLPSTVLSEVLEERLRQRLLVAFGTLFFVFTVPWFGWVFIRDPVVRPPRMIALAAFSILAANVLWLRLLPSRAVAWLSVVLLHIAFFVSVALNGGLDGPVVLVITCLPVVSAVLLGVRYGWIDVGVVMLFAIVLDSLERIRPLPITAPPELWSYLELMALAISLSSMLLAVASYAALSQIRARELVEARDDALAASRAKSRFLSTMSHELRTPMVGVIGATELLRRTPINPEQTEILDLLQSSASAQLELIGDILDLSRIEADRFELSQQPVAPRQVLVEIKALFRVACSAKGLTLEVKTEPHVPAWIIGDALRLRQILSNLVANALKFTEQGSITVHVRRVGWPDDPRLSFAVSDTGIGFDPELREALFESFRQGDESTTRRFGGSGLGLSICRRLVTAMGGTITATSTPGKGSTFTFEIPTLITEPPPDREGKATTGRVPQRRLTILLADDEPINRFIISAMLEELGHTAVEATHGRMALELAQTEPVDLIILDMHMPELDGPQCAQALRRLGPTASVPIIGLTADAVVENQTRYLASGIDVIYSKPISLEQLDRAISLIVSTTPLPS